MKPSAWVLWVVAATLVVGCGRDDQHTQTAPPSGVTSPAIDSLLLAVPGNASALAFIDLSTPPWAYVTGQAGMVLDETTRKTLDKELRAYIDRFVGVDVSKLQYAVGFLAGPPPSGAVIMKTVGGTPKFPGAADHEGGKVWLVDPSDRISLAIKGDTVILGRDDAVRSVLETLANKRKSVTVENPALVAWLHAESKGAAVAVAAVAPKGMPLPPQLAGLQRVAMSVSRAQVRAVVDGDDATITKLQQMIDQGIGEALAEVDRARDAANAGDLAPPEGAFAIIGAAYARSYATQVKPRRDGNRLVTSLDLGATGSDAMTGVAMLGILSAVAIPAFMDYMKKAKKTEASLQLNKLGKSLEIAYLTDATFPVGDAALTPATRCCEGAGAKCPVAHDAWQQPIWQALDFQIDEPGKFQYRYHSDGVTAVVEAVGDLDCDGQTITYRLDASAQGGNPSITITEPQPHTD